jgi:pyruvate carboxylase
MAQEIRYDNAGTIEFLYDLDRHEWFFIEMNPRIQVEHTVTEVITGIDLVRSQILIAQGHSLNSPELASRSPGCHPAHGYAIQCRVTTEDPENKLHPGLRPHSRLPLPGGFGLRLDGGMGYSGAVITPFYDSMLVKVIRAVHTFDLAWTAWTAPSASSASAASRRTFPSWRTSSPPRVPHRAGDDHPDRHLSGTLHLQAAPRPGHQAARLSGQHHRQRQPARQGLQARRTFDAPPCSHLRPSPSSAEGHPRSPARTGPQEIRRVDPQAKPPADHRHHLPRRPPVAHGHPGPHLRHARLRRRRGPSSGRRRHRPVLAGDVGRSDLRHRHAVPQRGSLGTPSPPARSRIPNICFQMLFRGSNAVGYSNYPDNVVAGFVRHAAEAGMDIFRIFDSLNYLPNLRVAMEAVQRPTPSARPRSATLATSSTPARQVLAQVLRPAGQGTGADGGPFPRDQGHGRALPSPRPASW